MEASHARPMTAYAALCAAAVVVLAQGVTSTNPGLADSIARVGDPARTFAVRAASTIGMQATEQVSRLGAEIGARVSQDVAPLDTPEAPSTTKASTGAAADGTRGDRGAQRTAATHTATGKQATAGKATAGKPTRQGGGGSATADSGTRDPLLRGGVLTPESRADAKADRRADRADARTERRADRAAAKADRQAERKADRADRKAARAKHRR